MREITFAWWIPGRICRILIEGGVCFDDLYVEEVQAAIDQMTYTDGDPDYQAPQATARPTPRMWMNYPHRSRPGDTFMALMDVTEAPDESLIVTWNLCYCGASVGLAEAEAEQMVQKWSEFLQSVPQKVDWAKEGF
jgi:hypothetical protein